jgi:hypothetical protein
MKTSYAKRKSRTHFEQIAVEVVKKIADGDGSTKERAGAHNVMVERASKKTGPYSVPGRTLRRGGH